MDEEILAKKKICCLRVATFYLDLLIFTSGDSCCPYLAISYWKHSHFFLLHKYQCSLGLWPQPLLFNFNIFFPKSYCPL